MRQALIEAGKAFEEEETPVGAVVVMDGKIIGRGYNRIEALKDPTAHAEILAIGAACESLGDKWLYGAELYVTLEPCSMCAGAIVLARFARLIFGAYDPKTGACGSLYDIPRDSRLNHSVTVTKGILADESQELLKTFFLNLRSETKK